MADTPTKEQPARPVAVAKPESSEPARYLIRVSSAVPGMRRVLFSTVSESRARQWLMNRCPRGEELYLELPDGSAESFQAERSDGEYGIEAEQWADFDPDSYQPQETMVPPGTAGWPDVEG